MLINKKIESLFGHSRMMNVHSIIWKELKVCQELVKA